MQVILELVSGGWFHNHPGAVILHRVPHVCGGPDRISHVVETIKECDKIVVLSRILLCLCSLEFDAIGYSCVACALLGGLNRFVVIIESEKFRFWKGLRHKDRRCSEAASHVRHN